MSSQVKVSRLRGCWLVLVNNNVTASTWNILGAIQEHLNGSCWGEDMLFCCKSIASRIIQDMSSSICRRLLFANKLRLSSMYFKFEVVFHISYNSGCLSFSKILRSFSILPKKLRSSSILPKNWGQASLSCDHSCESLHRDMVKFLILQIHWR